MKLSCNCDCVGGGLLCRQIIVARIINPRIVCLSKLGHLRAKEMDTQVFYCSRRDKQIMGELMNAEWEVMGTKLIYVELTNVL